ncbi:LCP family protein [Cryobacterium tepidiphilum]|uniref:LytR family transcriptional regulator n=1 Tax=Cryobacterium tepidiphilum TaxID=2486026 RepID=A0A3M8KU30_9MICO|nr:LCP family protein [Cryobacterium tepidiphilum]RNE56763.1 LytR family transcriptional regulator [Cryobacterium tepidiphilum]
MARRPASKRDVLLRAPLARHGRLARHGLRHAFALAGIALAVLVVSAVTVTAVALWDVSSSLEKGVTLPGDVTSTPAPDVNAIEGGVNLLLVGSDSGEGDPRFGERSEHLNDVTMLLHIAEDHASATVVSFPRDLFVEIPECPPAQNRSGGYQAPGTDGGFTDKINTALSYGGLGCVVATVQNLTGLSIPYAAEIEFNGVIAMSNAVGGVPVCVAEKIEDTHTDLVLEPGRHVLKGLEALQFLRTRYGLATGSDLARIGNQQSFLSSLVRVIKSDGTLNNPIKLYSLAKAAANNMVLSSRLQDLGTIVSIAAALRTIPLDRVAFLQYPVDEVDGGLVPRTDDADILFTALANDQPVTVSGGLGQASQPDDSPEETPTPTDAGPSPTDTPGAIPSPSGTPSAAPGPVELPDTISGQTAAERTCTNGRTLDEQ